MYQKSCHYTYTVKHWNWASLVKPMARIFVLGQGPLLLQTAGGAFFYHPRKSILQVEKPKHAHWEFPTVEAPAILWSQGCSSRLLWPRAVLVVSVSLLTASHRGKYSIEQPLEKKRHGAFLVVCSSWFVCSTCTGCVSIIRPSGSQFMMSNHVTSLNQS